MTSPLAATKLSALLSGVVLSLGIPAVEAMQKTLGLSQQVQQAIFLFTLALLFLGPVLLFVVGTEHLALRTSELLKSSYWSSLRQVGMRALFWLVGGGLGFAVLAAFQSFT